MPPPAPSGWFWAVVFANLDPSIGSEQAGRRPVLIVSNEDANQILSNVTVLPLTSTQRQLYPAEVLLTAGVAGQPRDSIVMAHQIRTISKQRIDQIYGYLLDPVLRDLVRSAIAEHLDP
jgi:mRNA interferase MazF